jgi:hypothetical protein
MACRSSEIQRSDPLLKSTFRANILVFINKETPKIRHTMACVKFPKFLELYTSIYGN